MKNRPRFIALVSTAIIALLIVVLLGTLSITVDTTKREWPPRHDGEVALAPEPEEQFFEVIEEKPKPAPKKENAAPAKNPVREKHKSEPKPESGHSTVDKGKVGDAPKTVTSKRPSEVKQKKKPQPKETGPSKEEIEAQKREEARRKANSATSSAFQRSNGKNNTESDGRTEGNSGSPTGKSQSVSGTGTGTVNGGWSMPSFAKVPATVTGSIKIRVKINSEGKVTSVSFQGGDAPAATDARLRRAVEQEVRSRRFTRHNAADAPDQATAYITYRFK